MQRCAGNIALAPENFPWAWESLYLNTGCEVAPKQYYEVDEGFQLDEDEEITELRKIFAQWDENNDGCGPDF